MSNWRQVPWPLWVFALAELQAAVRLEITVHGPMLVTVLYAALTLGWLYFVLRGVRWIWLVTIGLFVLGFAIDLMSGPLQWWAVILGLTEFMLLLLPATRRYFASPPTPAVL